jgi:hypothetical protein
MVSQSSSNNSELRNPSSFSPDEIISALYEAGGYVTGAAKILGCKRAALAKYIGQHVELDEVRLDAQEELLDEAEKGLRLAVYAEKAWAIRFALSRLGKARGYGHKLEIAAGAGFDGNMRVFEFPDDGREAKQVDDDGNDQATRGTADESLEQ